MTNHKTIIKRLGYKHGKVYFVELTDDFISAEGLDISGILCQFGNIFIEHKEWVVRFNTHKYLPSWIPAQIARELNRRNKKLKSNGVK